MSEDFVKLSALTPSQRVSVKAYWEMIFNSNFNFEDFKNKIEKHGTSIEEFIKDITK